MYRREFNTRVPLEDESEFGVFVLFGGIQRCSFTRITAVPIAHKHIFMMYTKTVFIQFLVMIWPSDLLILHLKEKLSIFESFWFCSFLNEMNSKNFINRKH